MKSKFKESKYYEDWFLKAERDLDTAFLNHRHGGYTDTTCYSCHQTAELSLKAFVVHHFLTFEKTQDLILLKNICRQRDEKFEDLTDSLTILNRYYIESKYPSDLPTDYPKSEADNAIETAGVIYDFAKGKLTGNG